jgi:transcriptional regulator with XRE-family HTH domain
VESNDPVGAIVAANLRFLRLRRRWTLKETASLLADQLGQEPLSESAISRWENPERPRRFSMTELFAICRVFEIPLARLFLPDRDSEIPTVNGLPFYAVWSACFSGSGMVLPDWQRLEQELRNLQDPSRVPFSDEQVAAAMELLRQGRAVSSDEAEIHSDGSDASTDYDE